jgi:hypothetical protein
VVGLCGTGVLSFLVLVRGWVCFGRVVIGGVREGILGSCCFGMSVRSFNMSPDIFKLTSGSSSHLCKLLSALKNLGCSVDT